jgi:outer membrane lipoprotein-sorting protein
MRINRGMALVLMVLFAAMAGASWCEAASKGQTTSKSKSMAQVMREQGFDYQHAQWTTEMTQTEEGGKVTKTTSKIWFSGDKMRMETTDRKTGDLMIMLSDGKDEYLYNPKEKTATKLGAMMRGMLTGMMDSDAFKEAADRRKSAKKVGSETVSGKPCTLYAYKQTFGGLNSDVKEWVWTGKNFPMKTIVKMPQQTMTMMGMTSKVPASTTETLVTDLVLNKPAAASLFQLPAGVKVQDMDQMMGGGASGGSEAGGGEEAGEAEEGEEGKDELPPEVQKMMKGLF